MPKLVSLNIEETSGVDHPAHLREGWMILKSADETEANKVLDTIKAAAGLTHELEAQMPEETPEVEADTTAADLEKAIERIAELEAALEAASVAEAVVEPVEEDLLKAAPEAIRKMIEDARSEAKQALAKAASTEEALRKERDTAADEKAVAKAAAWSSLSLDASLVGPALRRLSDMDTDLAKAVESALESANAQAESAGIFAEIGKAGRPDSGDAYGRLSSLAKAAVEAGTAPTFEQGFVKAAEENPDLYVQHLSEKGA